MKYMDYVKVIRNRPEYAKQKVYAGEIGNIWSAEIRANTFDVMFHTGDEYNWYKYCEIHIEDLEFVKGYEEEITDEKLLKALPSPDPRWWCKVKDGYIMNLKGEKKNKIPYKYDS